MDFFGWLFGTQSNSDSNSNSNSDSDSDAVTERSRSVESLIHGINIDGDSEFSSRIRQALDLLASKSPSDLYCIQQYTRNIAVKSLTGAFCWNFTIGIQPSYLLLNLPYLASVLVHENWHNRRYRITGISANSTEEELECIAMQSQVLRKIGGSSWEIRYLESLDGTHYLHSRV
jgi:hypothetical protein